MSDSENNSERRGNGDENAGNRQIPRGESEWSALLHRAAHETRRFSRFYENSFRACKTDAEMESDLDRLDECALAMGWQIASPDDDADVPAAGALSFGEPSQEPESEARERDDASAAAAPSPDVYSLHNLPECIAVRAICTSAQKHLMLLLKYVPESERDSLLWSVISLTDSLGIVRLNLMLAVDAEDALEFGLAVCLTKRAHAALNRYFARFEEITRLLRDAHGIHIAREIRCALMDLRDICLRILRDSRAELEKKQ